MPWTVAFGRVFVPETLLITAYFHRRRLTLARRFLGALLFAFMLAAGAQSTSYEGETENLLPHGQGTFTWESGNRYTGHWVRGRREGHGTFTWASNATYVGTWKDDFRHGEGTLIWADGSRYEGEWINDQKDGLGTLTYAASGRANSVQTFSGTFADDRPLNGVYRDSAGRELGQLINGEYRPTPQPCVDRQTETQFFQGKVALVTTCVFASGNRYEGEMKDGAYHGFGIFSWTDGTVYEGEWINGQQEGRGTLTFVDARQYIGDWNGGARHGHGVMQWPDGREYFGSWAKGQQNGQGTLLYADGSMYSGEWRDGEKWPGMHYDQTKKVLSSFVGGIETPL